MLNGSDPLLGSAGSRRARRGGGGKPASARLILDPLEPRVLLNADTMAVQIASLPNQTQTHDFLVQMINDTVTVGSRTQTVQRVQVIDQTSGGAVLAMGDLSEISAVAIAMPLGAVPSGADKITLDVDSFGAHAVPKLAVQGDGMTALAIDHGGGSVAWQVNGDGSGSASGAGANVSFTGVNSLVGGTGNDTLNAPAAGTTSRDMATNAGVTTYQGFESAAITANTVSATHFSSMAGTNETATVGVPFTINLPVADAGGAVIQSWAVDWGDGASGAPDVDTLGAGATTATHSYGIPSGTTPAGVYTIQVSLLDSSSTTPFQATPQTVLVTVASSDVSAGGAYSIAEGDPLTLQGTALGSPVSYAWTINGVAEAGTTATLALPWSTVEAAVPGAGTWPIALTALYSDGESATDGGATLTVANTPPVVTAANGGPVAQGADANVTLTIASPDSRVQSQPYGYVVSLNGSATPALSGTAGTNANGQATITIPAADIADHGDYQVTGTITDSEGGATPFSTTVTVDPVPEVLIVNGASTVAEGSTYALDLSAVHPSPESVRYWLVDWGDGGSNGPDVERFDVSAPTTPTVAEHTFELAGTYTVGVTAVDQDGPVTTASGPVITPDGMVSASLTVAATPVAPTVVLNPVTPVTLGSVTVLSGAIGEPGALENLTLTVDWGDGTQAAPDRSVVDVPSGRPSFELTHQYAVAGGHVVSATVTDSAGQSGSATTAVTITPLPPVIINAGFATPSTPEGGAVTVIPANGTIPAHTVVTPALLTGSIAPSLPADTDVVSVNWGDGSTSNATVDNTAHTFSATHVYLNVPDPVTHPDGKETATITAKDENNITATAAASIVVANVPPVITSFTASAPTLNEGGTETVTGVFTERAVPNTDTALIHWGDGTQSSATMNEASDTFSASHVYANNLAYAAGSPAPYTLTAVLTDNDNASTSATTQVTVANVLPVVDGLGTVPASLSDHNVFTLSGHVTDPGAKDKETVTIAWGDGSSSSVTADPVTRLFSATYTYQGVVPAHQASAPETITVTATDDVGAGAAAALPETVLATQLSLSALTVSPNTILAGAATTVTGAFTDGHSGATHTVLFTWGDGSTSPGTVDEGKGTYTATHFYDSEAASGGFAISAALTTSYGTTISATSRVTVTDVPPAVDNLALNAGIINEGDTVTLGGDIVDAFSPVAAVKVSWGDGGTSSVPPGPGQGTFTTTHTYANNGSFPISATVTDASEQTASAATSVIVNNVAPVIASVTGTSSAAAPVTAGQPVGFIVGFTDPGRLDTHFALVSWGDGSTASTYSFPASMAVLELVHVFSGAGNYPVTVRVEDGDGGISGGMAAVAYVSAPPRTAVNLPPGLIATTIPRGPAGLAGPVPPSGPVRDFSPLTLTTAAGTTGAGVTVATPGLVFSPLMMTTGAGTTGAGVTVATPVQPSAEVTPAIVKPAVAATQPAALTVVTGTSSSGLGVSLNSPPSVVFVVPSTGSGSAPASVASRMVTSVTPSSSGLARLPEILTATARAADPEPVIRLLESDAIRVLTHAFAAPRIEPPPLMLFDEGSGDFSGGSEPAWFAGGLTAALAGGIDVGDGWLQLPPPLVARAGTFRSR